jgi:hypothetical protein
MKHEHSEGTARGIAGLIKVALFIVAGFLIVAYLKYCK